MAGPRTWRNPSPVGKDKLTGKTPSKSSDTPTSTSIISCASISAPTQNPAPAPSQLGMYTNVDLQRATKLALELFVKGQKHGQANFALRKKVFKAHNSNLYYGSLHIECYYFCRQCEDNFDTANTMGYQCVSFATLFLRDRINFR